MGGDLMKQSILTRAGERERERDSKRAKERLLTWAAVLNPPLFPAYAALSLKYVRNLLCVPFQFSSHLPLTVPTSKRFA